MTGPVILYYAPDNASLCVRLALLELDMPFRTSLVDRQAHGQRAPAYLALNPNGLIPTLGTPDGPIYETAAILLWLADQRPGTVFPAAHVPTRGHALTQLFWLSNTLHPALRMLFYPDQYIATDTAALRDQCRKTILDLLQQLEDDPAAWLSGTAPDIRACYLAPMLRWVQLYGGETSWCDVSDFPQLQSFAETVENRPAMHEACRAEGLGETPISAPSHPNPPEGTAT